MATNDFEVNLSQELNLWAVRVFNKIKKSFVDYKINRVTNKKEGYTGDLYRRMWWTVHNAAGGKKALIQFFYMKYGDFVQWGVGSKFDDPRRKENPPRGQKLWDVPAMTSKQLKPIPQTEGYNYAAKPYLRREIRYHLSWLRKRLAEQYAYFGEYYIIKGVADGIGDPSITTKWIEENKSRLTNEFLDMMGMKR